VISPEETDMHHPRLAIIATLIALAGCAPQQGPAASEGYVPHGRFPAAVPLVQALHDCRQQVESAGRQSAPTTGPRALRQIPEPPPAARPAAATVQTCMDAKGYRRAAPSP
jgi:hypothetical protein